MLSTYQYLLSVTSLSQVAHPTSARSTGNRIQDQISRQYEGVTLSVPLKVVQCVVDIIPARVLSVFVAEPVKFFGLNALCHINYARMGGSGEFVASVSRTFYEKAVQKAPKITLVECWMVPDDLLEPLRLLISIVLLHNVWYGLCLLGLSGVVSRRFSDLRATHAYEPNGVLLSLHVRQLYHYVELIRRRHECDAMTVDQVGSFFTLQQDIYSDAIRLERSEAAEGGISQSSTGVSGHDKSKDGREDRDKPLPKIGACNHFNDGRGCRLKEKDCKYHHKCLDCNSSKHGQKDCPEGKNKDKAT